MHRYFWIAVLAPGIFYLGTTGSFADSVTADQALDLGKKLCTPLISDSAKPVRWSVYSADGSSNVENKNGKYWLVDGQYYPRTQSDVISVIDVTIFVPKDGTKPESCLEVLN